MARESFLSGGAREYSSLAIALGLHSIPIPSASLAHGVQGAVISTSSPAHGNNLSDSTDVQAEKVDRDANKTMIGSFASFGVDADMSWLDAHDILRLSSHRDAKPPGSLFESIDSTSSSVQSPSSTLPTP